MPNNLTTSDVYFVREKKYFKKDIESKRKPLNKNVKIILISNGMELCKNLSYL